MGTMMDKMHAAQAQAVGRATNMALVAGIALGKGQPIDEAIAVSRHANELMFGPYPEDSIDAKFYAESDNSVERFIRSYKE